MTTHVIKSAKAMATLGAELSKKVKAPAVVFLQGELGAGKTTLIQGWLHALGVKGPIKSPTYTLVEVYDLPSFQVYHFDFYRLTNPLELEAMGIRDYFTANSLCLIEWPERGEGVLPKADLLVEIEIVDDMRRVLVRENTPG